MNRKILLTALVGAVFALSACAKQGPVEKAGEKIDESVRTLKNGGEKTPGDKVKDAAEDLRSGAEKAADEVKK
jgi:hypothetical protein